MATKENKIVRGADLATVGAQVKAKLAEKQGILVSGVNIKTINNESLLGPGDIEIGSGIDALSSAQDGTFTISLTSGDTITVDLNHEHSQYLKYVYLTDEAEMPSNPDGETLYLILDKSS